MYKIKAMHAVSVVDSLCPPDPLPPALDPKRLFSKGTLTVSSALRLLVGFSLGQHWQEIGGQEKNGVRVFI